MSRMHSASKGKSGSKKPVVKKNPTWITYSQKEVKALIAKAAKKGLTGSQIGMYLRDNYGIPDVKMITGKSITQILHEEKLAPELPEDLVALIRTALKIRRHVATNGQDKTAKRGLMLAESKIKRLAKYLKATGKLKEEWVYDPEKASIYIE